MDEGQIVVSGAIEVLDIDGCVRDSSVTRGREIRGLMTGAAEHPRRIRQKVIFPRGSATSYAREKRPAS